MVAAAPDADLHARLAHFHDAYQKAGVAGAACVALREAERLIARAIAKAIQ